MRVDLQVIYTNETAGSHVIKCLLLPAFSVCESREKEIECMAENLEEEKIEHGGKDAEKGKRRGSVRERRRRKRIWRKKWKETGEMRGRRRNREGWLSTNETKIGEEDE